MAPAHARMPKSLGHFLLHTSLTPTSALSCLCQGGTRALCAQQLGAQLVPHSRAGRGELSLLLPICHGLLTQVFTNTAAAAQSPRLDHLQSPGDLAGCSGGTSQSSCCPKLIHPTACHGPRHREIPAGRSHSSSQLPPRAGAILTLKQCQHQSRDSDLRKHLFSLLQPNMR